MKRVINGLTYNTNTAEEIGQDDNGVGKSDFRFYDETLYKTKKGRFFLAGEGGALTKWAEPYPGGGSQFGSGIIALDKKDALEWCESHDIDPDIIAEHFEIDEA